ncbi:MAG TPA: GntR family transcriptional regulator [Ktedonobacteraceae bacterium]|nr:GntR family transcriptional regulator [Ktedonobacteraceae bacterium]
MANLAIARQSLVEQVREAVVDLLRDEQYTAGSALPSEKELGERFGASRATVREALKGLVQEGLLDCRHGKGYFVLSREAVFHKPITQLQSVTELMTEMGYTVENRVLRIREEMPTPQVRRQLQLDETQSILLLERVRSSRGEPLIYSVDIFPRTLIPGAWQELDWSGSLLRLFDEQAAQIASSRTTIRAVTLPTELCAQIGVSSRTAWLCMEQLNFTRTGKPVLTSHDYHRGENFQFYVNRRRY